MNTSEHPVDIELEVELLRAQLNIRDHALRSAVNTIYESTGQILSLIRVKLNTIENNIPDNLQPVLIETSELAGQAIRELREMSRNFYPEECVIKKSDLAELMQSVFNTGKKLDKDIRVTISGHPFEMANSAKLIFVSVLMDIEDQLKGMHTYVTQFIIDNLPQYLSIQLLLSDKINFSSTAMADYTARLQKINGQMILTAENSKTIINISVTAM